MKADFMVSVTALAKKIDPEEYCLSNYSYWILKLFLWFQNERSYTVFKDCPTWRHKMAHMLVNEELKLKLEDT